MLALLQSFLFAFIQADFEFLSLCAAATRWECDLTHLSKSNGDSDDGFQSLQKAVIP